MVDRLSQLPSHFLKYVIKIYSGNSEANTRRIQNVEACFGGSGRPLLEADRVLVGEGVLVKMCRFANSGVLERKTGILLKKIVTHVRIRKLRHQISNIIEHFHAEIFDMPVPSTRLLNY
jgi:hypothetical protein